MLIKYLPPKPALREFVRSFQIISWEFDKAATPPPKLLAPRPEHSLAFYVRDPQYFNFLDTDELIKYPTSILSGIHEKTIVSILSGIHEKTIVRDCGRDFLTIKVIFQPCALFRLTGIPARELVSNFIDAEVVFGKEIKHLYERLNSSNDLNEMINLIELYVEKHLLYKAKNESSIDKISEIMLNQVEFSGLEKLARQTSLSTRQLIRNFEERTGVSPKLFNRVVRFDKVYRFKNNNPDLDWLSVALACGYYDYQHLAKDYKDFTNSTPVGYFEIDQKAPERVFGMYFG